MTTPVSTSRPDYCGSYGSTASSPTAASASIGPTGAVPTTSATRLPAPTRTSATTEDMSLACAAQDGGLLCHITAGVYYQAVHRLGDEAFDHAQEAAPK